MKLIQENQHIIESSDCMPNMLSVIDLSLILFNTSFGIHSVPKKSKYTAVFLSINNETECVPFLCWSSRFMTYAPSIILGKLSLEKTPLNLGS